MFVFYDWPFPHVYFAKTVVYFPFNSWLSFQRLCRLLWECNYMHCVDICCIGFYYLLLIRPPTKFHLMKTFSPSRYNCWLVTQEAQLSPSNRAMRPVSSNLANYHATVQKLLIRPVLTKPMVWSWRFSWRQCVINKLTTVELCRSSVYRRLAAAKFSKSTM